MNSLPCQVRCTVYCAVVEHYKMIKQKHKICSRIFFTQTICPGEESLLIFKAAFALPKTCCSFFLSALSCAQCLSCQCHPSVSTDCNHCSTFQSIEGKTSLSNEFFKTIYPSQDQELLKEKLCHEKINGQEAQQETRTTSILVQNTWGCLKI